MKKCGKCQVVKDCTEFYRDKSKKSGYSSYCKDCCKIYNSTAGRENLKRYRSKPSTKKKLKLYAREYRQTEYNREYRKSYKREYDKSNPEKIKARSKIKREIQSGRIEPASTHQCLVCGNQAEVYHHWSYEKEHWLDVIPLCRQCHANIHRETNQ